MISDWQSDHILRRADGSYVIVTNGRPYHAPNSGEWAALWAEIDAYAQAHPEQVTDEPAPPQPTEEELLERAKSLKLSDLEIVQKNIAACAYEASIAENTAAEKAYKAIYKANELCYEQINGADSVDAVNTVGILNPSKDNLWETASSLVSQ